MRKWLRYTVGFSTVSVVVMIIAVMLILREDQGGCACSPSPYLTIDQEQAEHIIAAEIPDEATEVQISKYGVDYEDGGFTASETYVSFQVEPDTAAAFIASLPNLAPMQANYNPFATLDTYVTNFGTINGTPEKFEGSTYEYPLCERSVMVDQSDADLYEIFVLAQCEE